MTENCVNCGAFFNGVFCNKCGTEYCSGCYQELDDVDYCIDCEPKEYLEHMETEFIPACQRDNEISSCNICPDYKTCCWLRDVKDLKERLQREGRK